MEERAGTRWMRWMDLDEAPSDLDPELIRAPTDKEKKKWRTQQEGTWPRHIHALLELLALRRQGQGHQALYREEHGRECCRPGY